ncbi:MAG TPA: FAD-dependent oxidoreductase [Solirubrobacteraceae bacterium]
MRLTVAGVAPGPLDLRIAFEGREIACSASDSVASALTAAGEVSCRETRHGDRRGVFCGMGVCQECLVEIDGLPGRRACTTLVRNGMVVRRQPARPDAAAAPAITSSPLVEREVTPDVLVVGGGPAGMAAAVAAARAGAQVTLVDERAKLGGQYYKQPAAEPTRVEPERLDRQFRRGRELADAVRTAGVEVLAGAEIWSAFAPDDLRAVDEATRWRLRPQRLVLATGAYERGWAIPGWTLPGVLTTGAAQSLLRAHQVAPGRRVLVSGNGPLNMQLAAELVRAGAEVVALAELARITSPRRAAALARMAASAPDLVRDGIRYRAALTRARVPVLTGAAVVACEGDGRLRSATVARIDDNGAAVVGSERTFEADAVCLGFGFAPARELALALGVPHDLDARLGIAVPRRDDAGGTPVKHVWIAGDAAGVGGGRVAQAAGTLAGAAAARSLGHAPDPAVVAAARRSRDRAAAFQRALWTVFDAPTVVDELATPQTPMCRCESVTRAQLEPLLAEDDVGHIGALKRATRAGMGGCQGRYCATVLAQLAARRSGRRLDERSGFAPAAPAKPVRIGDLLGD